MLITIKYLFNYSTENSSSLYNNFDFFPHKNLNQKLVTPRKNQRNKKKSK